MGRLYCFFPHIRIYWQKEGMFACMDKSRGRYSPNSTESSPTLPSTHILLHLLALLLPPQTTTATPPTSTPHAETPHYDLP